MKKILLLVTVFLISFVILSNGSFGQDEDLKSYESDAYFIIVADNGENSLGGGNSNPLGSSGISTNCKHDFSEDRAINRPKCEAAHGCVYVSDKVNSGSPKDNCFPTSAVDEEFICEDIKSIDQCMKVSKCVPLTGTGCVSVENLKKEECVQLDRDECDKVGLTFGTCSFNVNNQICEPYEGDLMNHPWWSINLNKNYCGNGDKMPGQYCEGIYLYDCAYDGPITVNECENGCVEIGDEDMSEDYCSPSQIITPSCEEKQSDGFYCDGEDRILCNNQNEILRMDCAVGCNEGMCEDLNAALCVFDGVDGFISGVDCVDHNYLKYCGEDSIDTESFLSCFDSCDIDENKCAVSTTLGFCYDNEAKGNKPAGNYCSNNYKINCAGDGTGLVDYCEYGCGNGVCLDAPDEEVVEIATKSAESTLNHVNNIEAVYETISGSVEINWEHDVASCNGGISNVPTTNAVFNTYAVADYFSPVVNFFRSLLGLEIKGALVSQESINPDYLSFKVERWETNDPDNTHIELVENLGESRCRIRDNSAEPMKNYLYDITVIYSDGETVVQELSFVEVSTIIKSCEEIIILSNSGGRGTSLPTGSTGSIDNDKQCIDKGLSYELECNYVEGISCSDKVDESEIVAYNIKDSLLSNGEGCTYDTECESSYCNLFSSGATGLCDIKCSSLPSNECSNRIDCLLIRDGDYCALIDGIDTSTVSCSDLEQKNECDKVGDVCDWSTINNACIETGVSTCGNGIIEGNERCDGTDFGDESCEHWGYLEGELACNSCTVDITGCVQKAILSEPYDLSAVHNINDNTIKVSWNHKDASCGSAISGNAITDLTGFATDDSLFSGTVNWFKELFGGNTKAGRIDVANINSDYLSFNVERKESNQIDSAYQMIQSNVLESQCDIEDEDISRGRNYVYRITAVYNDGAIHDEESSTVLVNIGYQGVADCSFYQNVQVCEGSADGLKCEWADNECVKIIEEDLKVAQVISCLEYGTDYELCIGNSNDLLDCEWTNDKCSERIIELTCNEDASICSDNEVCEAGVCAEIEQPELNGICSTSWDQTKICDGNDAVTCFEIEETKREECQESEICRDGACVEEVIIEISSEFYLTVVFLTEELVKNETNTFSAKIIASADQEGQFLIIGALYNTSSNELLDINYTIKNNFTKDEEFIVNITYFVGDDIENLEYRVFVLDSFENLNSYLDNVERRQYGQE